MFGGLTDEELEAVRQYLVESFYPKGSYLLTQGEPNNKVFFILDGEVSIEKHGPAAKRKYEQLAVFSHGDCFGEMELIDIQPCAASARALQDTTVVTLTNGDLYKLSKTHLKTYTMIILNLAREISRRLRATDEKLVLELYARK